MSDKPLLERLQVKNGRSLAVVNGPSDICGLVDAIHHSVEEADVVLVFFPDRGLLERCLAETSSRLRPDAILWIAYPKLTSALASDLSRDVVRRLAQDHGLDTVSQIAVDDTWSAMRLKRI
jgi:hypothetical protein